MNLFSLFRKRTKADYLPSAVIFVDYEHWSISLEKLYGMKPRVKERYDEISKQYSVKKIMFFGDFTNSALHSQMDNIREITNNIIDTANSGTAYKKDFTDFIMLDYIYQEADEHPEITTYILFTGDGHFSSVARYLKIRKQKKVIIYGVKGAVSGKLKSIADNCVELPTADDERGRYYTMIIENFNYLFTKRQKKVYPTFFSTIKNVASHYNVSEENVQMALQELINMGVIVKKAERVDFNKSVRILCVDWEQAINKGLWSADRA